MPEVLQKAPELGAWIGRPVTRHEDERLLRGLGRYVDDHDPPGVLHMAVGRSPYPHARIRRIDVSRALQLPGVHAVLTGDEVVRRSEPILVLRPHPTAKKLPYYAMAREVAVFEGQPVVSVVADDRYLAEDALELIEIDYEPLPAVVSGPAALAEGAPQIHPDVPGNLLVLNRRRVGDPDAAFAQAGVVVSDRFVINRVIGLPLEGRAILAEYTPGLRTLTVRSSTQVPHLVRLQLSVALRVPEADIRVIASDVGGGFGLKLGIYPEDVIACLHAMDLGRPVKWVEDRMEHFRTTTHARESVHEAAIAATRDGRILAMRNVYVVDSGAFNSPFGPPRLTQLMFPGPYRLEHCYLEQRAAITNKTPVGAYRGYGQPESNFVREVLMDRLARAIGMDPVELRRKNLLTPEELPRETAGGAVYEGGDYRRTLDLAVEKVGYWEIRRQQPELWARGAYVGVGVSCYMEKTGYPGSAYMGQYEAPYGAHEGVTIRFNRSGGVDLYTPVSSIGQSVETTYAQLCASLLGLHPRQVRVHAGDTLGTPYGAGSFSSRTTIAAAGAVEAAAAQIREKALRLAAHLLGVAPERLDLVDGRVQAMDDPSRQIGLADLATAAITGHRLPPGETPGLEATAYYDPPASAYGYGAAAAVVRVEPRTGQFKLERLVFVHDCGTVVNPMLVDGQVHGGLVQALGAALFEELVYDPDSGQLINGSMMDYFVPTAADVPDFEVGHAETPSPVTPFGVRGVGESGTIPTAAAIVNAICDALSPLGIQIRRLPVTPESVWRALQQVQQEKK